MFIPKSHVAGFSGSLVQLREFHRHASCLVSLRNTREPLKVRLYQYTILQIVISLHAPLDVDFCPCLLDFLHGASLLFVISDFAGLMGPCTNHQVGSLVAHT
jgi:hypothetical protein